MHVQVAGCKDFHFVKKYSAIYIVNRDGRSGPNVSHEGTDYQDEFFSK